MPNKNTYNGILTDISYREIHNIHKNSKYMWMWSIKNDAPVQGHVV